MIYYDCQMYVSGEIHIAEDRWSNYYSAALY